MEADPGPEQTLEEMAELLQKAGYKVTAQDIAAEINYRERVKFERAMKAQFAAAKENGSRRLMRDDRGSAVGYVNLQIHPTLRNAICRRFGREAMNDDGFIKDLLKSHPELRVDSRSDRLTIVKPEIGGHSAPNIRPGVHGRRGRWAA